MKKNIYLAGPIRLKKDFSGIEDYDVKWREEIISYYKNNNMVRFYNPVNVNFINYCKKNNISHLDSKSLNYIYTNDIRMIKHSDICLVNLIPLTKDKYPCFGTIAEIGMFIQNKKDVIILCEEETKEHLMKNPMYITCNICVSMDKMIGILDDLLHGYSITSNKQEQCCNFKDIIDKISEFEDPFLQTKFSVDYDNHDIIIIHNVSLGTQTVYKALYRRVV